MDISETKGAIGQRFVIYTLLISISFPVNTWALSVADAKHLALRTSFAASSDLMNALLPLSREDAVTYVLMQQEAEPIEPPAFVINPEPRPKYKDTTPKERQAAQKLRRNQQEILKRWWMARMVTTSAPIEEQMLLFWHNHFTTSAQKVRDPIIIYQQHEILRKQALGRFDVMLRMIMQDPAMLNYLDNSKNKKGKPNENLARELLELYTLGEGHYTEKDVKETARALTGWGVSNKRTHTFYVNQHDDGSKTILGKTGKFSMPEVLDLLLSKPQVSRFIVDKLWRQFISQTPDQLRTKELAEQFKNHQYDIYKLMKQLLMEDAFWSENNRAVLVKSPVEMVVGLYRQMDVDSAPYNVMVNQAKQLGQNLFTPPNVKGWPIASVDWVDTSTLLKRQNTIGRLMRAQEMANTMQQGEVELYNAASAWVSTEMFSYQKAWLLAAPPVSNIAADVPLNVLRNLLKDPVYQLK